MSCNCVCHKTATKTPSSTPAAKPSAATATKPAVTPFEASVLAEHNRLRAKHSAAPLKLNREMSRYAQEWANNMAAKKKMYHRTNGKYGENLYASHGLPIASVTGKEVVGMWYNEIRHFTSYGVATPATWGKTGHFTQVIWKASKELGVGIAKNGTSIYVCCTYNPCGNFFGHFAQNVSRN